MVNNAKKHGLGDFPRWPSELHQGVEGHQGLPQGFILEQIFHLTILSWFGLRPTGGRQWPSGAPTAPKKCFGSKFLTWHKTLKVVTKFNFYYFGLVWTVSDPVGAGKCWPFGAPKSPKKI